MKNLLWIFCLPAVFASAQDSKSVTGNEIKEVKIFQSGAQVTRHISASLAGGIMELNLNGLSASIDKNSISVTGTGDAVLLSVVHQLNYMQSEKKSAEQIRLEDSLDFYQTDQEKSNALESVFNDEQALLQSNKSVGGANVGVNIDNLQKISDFFRIRMTELKTKLIDVHRKQKKLKDKISAIQQQLTELNTKRNQPTSTIAITVSTKLSTAITLDLSYYVTGAGWTPHYDVRAKDIQNPVQVAYKASVFQNTGENWEKVKLKLSSANPTLGGTKPTLNSWYLDFYQPVYRNKAQQMDQGYAVPQSQSRTLEEIQAAPVRDMNSVVARSTGTTANYTEITENQLSVDFDIKLAYSIPSDGKMHTVDVQSYSVPALYSYFAVPKLDKDAFLIARITGWENLNLLPGKANIYFEGAYVGESFIDPQSTNDTLDLSFGRDKKIVITREMKKDLSSTKFIGNSTVKELKYVITVRNAKKESITIMIEDQVPVTKNTDITLKDIEYSGGDYNAETGKVAWKLDIQPGTIAEKILNFSVKYPKDKTVIGL